ncbi:hypothetical protein CBR_g29563 [Chara braunii]|uniref:Citrate transporter-like domain-containing protein n=1 Tax=Chara braunii TaxID=69332 RepID=A0A388LAV4_CHABU|nr:hypothetical protein CBR_g29563 [Chara braunii]|eukprot:GBG79416.1 hypothetical protein CBR_g29563 [Chara braunii]
MASAMGSAAGSATVAAMGSSCAISLPKGSHARFSSSSAAAGRHQPEQRPLLSCRHVALAERGRGLDSVCQNRQAVNRHSTATWYTHRHVEVGIRHVGRKDTQVDRGSNLKHRHVADCSALSASILPRVITSTIKQDDWLSSVLAGRQSGWLGRASTWQTHVSRSRRTLKTPYSSPVRAKTKVKSTEDHKLTNSAGSRAEEDTLKNDDGPMAEAGSQDTFGTSSVNEPSLAQESQEIKLAAIDQKTPNLVKGSAIAAVALAAVTALANLDVVAQHQDLAMAVVFALGYAGIVFEESLSLNKSAVALVMAVTLWTIRSIAAPSSDIAVVELSEQASSVSEIIFFLLGAMTIVEVVDAHQGFSIVTDAISTRNTRTLLWVIGFLSFFLSSILENLTTTIVMVSLLRKLITNPEQRKYCGAAVVIAANAGGAWTPIGDVTTTMLWIHGQVTTVKIMQVTAAMAPALPKQLIDDLKRAREMTRKEG